jgi:hypothetical protein
MESGLGITLSRPVQRPLRGFPNMKTHPKLRLIAASLLFAPLAQAETYILTVENLAPAEGVHLTPVWVGFHAGDFALFEIDGTASIELERIAEDGAVMPLDSAFRAGDPGRTSVTVANPEDFTGAPVFEPGSRSARRIELDPARHRFLSYASMVIPSNDAFVGNPGGTQHSCLWR